MLLQNAKGRPLAVVENKVDAPFGPSQLKKYSRIPEIKRCRKVCFIKHYKVVAEFESGWHLRYWGNLYLHLRRLKEHDRITEEIIAVLKDYGMDSPLAIGKSDLKRLAKAMHAIRYNDEPSVSYNAPIFETMVDLKKLLEDLFRKAAKRPLLRKRVKKAFRPNMKVQHWWDDERKEGRQWLSDLRLSGQDGIRSTALPTRIVNKREDSRGDYAETYLKEGFQAVRPLGARFRDLLPGRARGEFWEKALKQLDQHIGNTLPYAGAQNDAVPLWTTKAGGADRWKKWIDKKARACLRRARKLAVKRGLSTRIPTEAEWRRAIRLAVQQSDGRGHFSRLPLSLDTRRNEKHACWPSIGHLDGTFSTNVAIELRVFNDLKTILKMEELRKVVGHLAIVMNAPLVRLKDDWECERSYAVEQPPEEPPLPAP